MENIIIILVVVIIVGLAGFYVYKAKKSGKKCIGCPDGCSCSSKNTEKKETGCGCDCSSCNSNCRNE